jgi:glutathione S-transferase
MKLYYDPVSTTCRPVMLFAQESGLALDYVPIDLFQGQHRSAEYLAINPNAAVPLLEDGEFRMTECSAILKYLADTARHASYPTDLQSRARVNQAMDWLNTGLYRDLGYGVVYPQILPDYGYPNPATQADLIRRAHERAARWLLILDRHCLADSAFMCGPDVTLADYMGAAYVTLADWIDFDFSPYPNVTRWLSAMRARPSWSQTQAPWNGLVAMLRDQRRQSA